MLLEFAFFFSNQISFACGGVNIVREFYICGFVCFWTSEV